jgi:hypothetical protein
LLDLEAKNSVKRRGPPGQEQGKAARFPGQGEESGISSGKTELFSMQPDDYLQNAKIPSFFLSQGSARILPEKNMEIMTSTQD